MADKKLTIHDDRDAEETGSIISLGFVLTTQVSSSSTSHRSAQFDPSQNGWIGTIHFDGQATRRTSWWHQAVELR